MTETEKPVREYLAKIGRRGGVVSRRELTKSRAKKMIRGARAPRVLV
jgi:hypothetical protein